jgi:hypothetical protein
MFGIYDMMDLAFAQEVGVTVDVWEDVIENHCTHEEAEEIISGLWEEGSKLAKSKKLFNNKLKIRNGIN